MLANRTPMRWPSAWRDPSALEWLKGTAIDSLVMENHAELAAVRTQASHSGLTIVDSDSPSSGITIVKGQWPGIKMSRGGGTETEAGPTGVPWVDSNGWAIRLSAALSPESEIWVNAPPKENLRPANAYLIAVADSAAYGGRWIIELDNQLAAGIAARQSESMQLWKNITAAAGFFAAHKAWATYVPEAVVGVISDFAGQNKSLSRELLNLLARSGQHYRIIVKGKAEPFTGLRALIYADAEPPSPGLQKQILDFVVAGGLLITGPKWGAAPGRTAARDEHPRFSSRVLGHGRVAVAHSDPNDPYMLANDSVVLVSHRYDLVRFWNGGAVASYYSMARDRKRAVVHLLFYADRGPDSASVRIAGRYRAAKMWTLDQPDSRKVEFESQADAVEVHLPAISQYVALELEV
jgi:hypothetical protein